ncbi:PEP-CTERM sorting domain-containing protein [uncultured Paludibaculum sp.]|uniref:PEP-CTERM sorting domain-containing protein n=1 Tax=uncultured Paludibaculum sp. TaxID=1765020 RepID=UPI002AAA6BA8|nr:PEP-CTERM sorting domain-containing protein [uncultured Paludibaculum sp.]
MGKLLSCALLVCAFSATAPAAVLTFEDLTGSGVVPIDYAGVTWDGFWSYYDSPQDPYNPASGVERVYNYGTRQFAFATPVVFNGAYFAGTDNLQYDLYLTGGLVASSGSIELSSTPTFLASGYSGLIDEVRVNATPGYFVMDDVTFNASAVPEPTSIGLVGLGLAGLLVRRFRR